MEALVAGHALDREISELRGDPALQGVRAEVLRDDEVSRATGSEPGEPELQHAVQHLLSDSDRRIRVDLPETQLCGNVLGRCHVYGVESETRSIRAGQLARALVDINGPDLSIGIAQGGSERDRSPATAEVEHRARPSIVDPLEGAEQDLRTAVEVLWAEHATRGLHAAGSASEDHLDLAGSEIAARGLGEVMLAH